MEGGGGGLDHESRVKFPYIHESRYLLESVTNHELIKSINDRLVVAGGLYLVYRQELVWNDPGLLEGNKKYVLWSNWRFYTCLFEQIKEDKIVSILYFSAI